MLIESKIRTWAVFKFLIVEVVVIEILVSSFGEPINIAFAALILLGLIASIINILLVSNNNYKTR